MICIPVSATFEGTDDPLYPAYLTERGGIWITLKTTLLLLKKFFQEQDMEAARELAAELNSLRSFKDMPPSGISWDIKLIQVPKVWDTFRVQVPGHPDGTEVTE
jgi:hypothetical protein